MNHPSVGTLKNTSKFLKPEDLFNIDLQYKSLLKVKCAEWCKVTKHNVDREDAKWHHQLWKSLGLVFGSFE